MGHEPVAETDSQTELELDAMMASCYRRTPPIPLRAFDAIHLAAARVAGDFVERGS